MFNFLCGFCAKVIFHIFDQTKLSWVPSGIIHLKLDLQSLLASTPTQYTPIPWATFPPFTPPPSYHEPFTILALEIHKLLKDKIETLLHHVFIINS